ncbi:hypothetical protein HYW53_00315 [Candidatus Giovannonibacteria bacterium]|nr:hypothetical protein [Candidatus Giovannonibacteria bacterium]
MDIFLEIRARGSDENITLGLEDTIEDFVLGIQTCFSLGFMLEAESLEKALTLWRSRS